MLKRKRDIQSDLFEVCRIGDRVVVESLLDTNQALINQAMYDGVTPLWIACQNGYKELAELLLDRGADINQARQDGATPLWVACLNGQLEVAELLLARGALINQTMDGAKTPLFIACQFGHRDIVELLLDRGANINQAMSDGTTPLSISCELGHLAISELLIALNKFEGYTSDQLKKIICSCVADHHADSPSTMSYCMIGYQCYKHLGDPNYTLDA